MTGGTNAQVHWLDAAQYRLVGAPFAQGDELLTQFRNCLVGRFELRVHADARIMKVRYFYLSREMPKRPDWFDLHAQNCVLRRGITVAGLPGERLGERIIPQTFRELQKSISIRIEESGSRDVGSLQAQPKPPDVVIRVGFVAEGKMAHVSRATSTSLPHPPLARRPSEPLAKRPREIAWVEKPAPEGDLAHRQPARPRVTQHVARPVQPRRREFLDEAGAAAGEELLEVALGDAKLGRQPLGRKLRVGEVGLDPAQDLPGELAAVPALGGSLVEAGGERQQRADLLGD